MSRDLRILEPTPLPPEVVPPAASPVIVIQYRRSWITIIMMPWMILITAAAVLSHRLQADDWRGLAYHLGFAEPAARPPQAKPTTPPAELPPLTPLIVTVIPEPPPTPLPAPSLLAPPVVIPDPVVAATPEVAPQPASQPTPPVVKAEEIWDDIRRESERKQAEAQILEDSKELQLQQQQRLTQQKKLDQMRRDRIKQINSRVTFRDAVRDALSGPEELAGPIIRGLCSREGVRIGGGSTIMHPPSLITTSTARRERVQMLRGQSFSEAMILNDLILLENRNRVSRRAGIRTVDDVVVRASRHLLMVPLDEPEARLVKSSRR